jgi:hypothetical protein
LEEGGWRREGKLAVGIFGKHALAGQQAQEAGEGSRVCASGLGQGVGTLGAVFEEVRNAELGRHIHRLSEPIALEQASEHRRG